MWSAQRGGKSKCKVILHSKLSLKKTLLIGPKNYGFKVNHLNAQLDKMLKEHSPQRGPLFSTFTVTKG